MVLCEDDEVEKDTANVEDTAGKTPQVLEYSLKIINRLNPAGIVIEKFEDVAFVSKQSMKEKLMSILQSGSHIKDTDGMEFGYIIPGHGFKGKQYAINSDEDVTQMYDVYQKKKPIILWSRITSHARKRLTELNSEVSSKKKKVDDETQPRRSNYQNHVSKMAEVDSIVEELEKKHTGKYSPEQIRAWAHMLQLKKHGSYESPPDKPFFRSKSCKSVRGEQQGISPAKRITLRSECIDQLEKWHSLMERGAITTEQYKELQDKIMSDIKDF